MCHEKPLTSLSSLFIKHYPVNLTGEAFWTFGGFVFLQEFRLDAYLTLSIEYPRAGVCVVLLTCKFSRIVAQRSINVY